METRGQETRGQTGRSQSHWLVMASQLVTSLATRRPRQEGITLLRWLPFDPDAGGGRADFRPVLVGLQPETEGRQAGGWM